MKIRDVKLNEATAKIGCTKCDEVSTAKAWEKNGGTCPKCKKSTQGVAETVNEGWYEMPPLDRNRYEKRSGLEGPFQSRSGKVLYYDPREGAYYDPDSDMYLTYDEYHAYDNPKPNEPIDEDLPQHLAKFIGPDGNFTPDAQARIDAGNKKRNAKKWVDVTPKGYSPSGGDEVDAIKEDHKRGKAERKLRLLTQQYQGIMAGAIHGDEHDVLRQMKIISRFHNLDLDDYLEGNLAEDGGYYGDANFVKTDRRTWEQNAEEHGAQWVFTTSSYELDGKTVAYREEVGDDGDRYFYDYYILDDMLPEQATQLNASASAYQAQMDQAHAQIYPGKQKPPAALMKALADEERERRAAKKKEIDEAGGNNDAQYLVTDGAGRYFVLTYQQTPGSHPLHLRKMLDQKAEELGFEKYDVVTQWVGDIDQNIKAAAQHAASWESSKAEYPAKYHSSMTKVEKLSKAKEIMATNTIEEDSVDEAIDPQQVIKNFLNKKTKRAAHGEKLRKARDEKEKYKPGVTKLKRSISFNDFEGHKGAEDFAKVKRIRWPYGIEVSYDNRNKEVTFYTAKMKTVAKILNKHIDFDSLSAGEVLDLPSELMGEDNQSLGENNDKVYAVRTTGNGFVIFGPYNDYNEATYDAGPNLEAVLPSIDVSRKLRQKIDLNGQASISTQNYQRMVDEDKVVGDSVKYRNIKSKRDKTGKVRNVSTGKGGTKYELDNGAMVYDSDLEEGTPKERKRRPTLAQWVPILRGGYTLSNFKSWQDEIDDVGYQSIVNHLEFDLHNPKGKKIGVGSYEDYFGDIIVTIGGRQNVHIDSSDHPLRQQVYDAAANLEEGTHDYPDDIKGKGNQYFDPSGSKNREKRKEFRKKQKAMAHKEIMTKKPDVSEGQPPAGKVVIIANKGKKVGSFKLPPHAQIHQIDQELRKLASKIEMNDFERTTIARDLARGKVARHDTYAFKAMDKRPSEMESKVNEISNTKRGEYIKNAKKDRDENWRMAGDSRTSTSREGSRLRKKAVKRQTGIDTAITHMKKK